MVADAASPQERPAPTGAGAPDGAASSAAADTPPPAERRTRTVAVRLTVAEEAVWISAAWSEGHRQLGAWVRERAVARYLGRRAPASPAVSAEAVAEINAVRQEMARWGNNLNQIARAVNSGAVPAELVEHLHEHGAQCTEVLARIADRLDALEG